MGLEPISAVFGQVAGYTLEKSPAHYRAEYSNMINIIHIQLPCGTTTITKGHIHPLKDALELSRTPGSEDILNTL